MVLELNASDDRGIDVVREQIKTFASTKQIFTAVPTADTASISAFKLIILDEADAMTSTAQMALRRIMEKYTANTRFCIIANYTHKLSPALLSRCTRFRFSPLKEPDIRSLVDHVIENENIKIQEEATESLVRLSKGDMRRALNVLQACHASSRAPLPLQDRRSTSSILLTDTRPLIRYPPPPQKPTPTLRILHPTHHNHQRHHLRLHRRPAPLRHRPHHRHPAPKPRHHFLPQHRQYAKIRQGARARRYPYRRQRKLSEIGSPAADEGRVARRVGGNRVSIKRGRR
ncbi:MAG: hypothetical protein Q9180_009335 [Flavoplaca navasiana]